MLFNSLGFLIFFALVLLLFHGLLRSWSAKKLLLLAASWLFYASWSPRFLLLLIATTAVDYAFARVIWKRRWLTVGEEKPGGAAQARPILIASLILNLGVLAVFKYGLFFWDSVTIFAPLPNAPKLLEMAVPLGISFYTFHSISYVIDTWRGVRAPCLSFSDYSLYVAFFPQLVAGPITRWGFFGPQLVTPTRVGRNHIEIALFLLAVGYIKKVVCADSLGGFVDGVYARPDAAGQIGVILAVYAYTFQIYFDFSGYTDIAMGVAALLGFRLPENFRHPYLAENPSEFWRRWHVSLSTWLRDYLYVPLGGNRRGGVRTYVNLFLTMLLGGLWHGAAWTFVLWGAFHGLWLGVHRYIGGRTAFGPANATVARTPRTPLWLRRVATFHLVSFGWILFRAGSIESFTAFMSALVTPSVLPGAFPIGPLLIVLIGLLTHGLALRRNLQHLWGRVPQPVQGMAYGAVVIAVALFSAQSGRFIYFQF